MGLTNFIVFVLAAAILAAWSVCSGDITYVSANENVILAVGMLGTGTSSLKAAIDIVTVNNVKCYDVHSVSKDSEKWKTLFSSSTNSENLIKSIVKDAFPASSDKKQPICLVDVGFALPQLLKVYPKAKVILTTRDFESWFYNYVKSFLAVDDSSQVGVGNTIYNIVIGSSKSESENDVKNIKSDFTTLWKSANVLSSNDLLDKSSLNEDFIKWINNVKKIVPADQLLEIPFGDGDLNALCTFLNCDSRAASLTWKYYPHSAESEEQEKHLKKLEARNLIGLLIGFIGLLISLWLACFISPSKSKTS